jgi:glycerol-3-phosphate dehydrogenase
MPSHYDLLIIGAGIHGVGVAQAAAAAGYSVLTLEQTALAAGTSSKSSKLIHGGLRYLESGRIGMVREGLRERALLLRLAPELVRLTPFFIPIYPDTRRRPWQIALGLSMYALLGGLARENRFARIPRSEWQQLDGLDTRGLQCVYRYFDAQTDDAALTRAVMRSAQSLGAELRLPAKFVGARRSNSSWLIDYLDGVTPAACTASAIVNASGAWANDVLAQVAPRPPIFPVELVQGSHIVLDTPTTRGVFYVEAPDRRAVFVMPWYGKSLVGTTETVLQGDAATVRPQPEEIAYLQDVFRRHFPDKSARVIESFAGVRVLPSGNSSVFQRSRGVVFLADDARNPKLITIYGGKLTSYRATAARALAMLAGVLPPRTPRADSAALPLTKVD